MNYLNNDVQISFELPQPALQNFKLSLVRTRIDNVNVKLNSSRNVYDVIFPFFGNDIILRELFLVCFLDRNNNLLSVYPVSMGGVAATIVDIRLLFACAILELASSIILIHNHPSGNLKASQADINITNNIKEVCKLFDIKLLDHLIISDYDYFSFADNSLI